LPVIPKHECREGNEKFSERWMHVNKVLRLDVFGCKLSEMYFIEPGENMSIIEVMMP